MRYHEIISEAPRKRKRLSPEQEENKAELARLRADDEAFKVELERIRKYRDPFKELERAAEAEGNYKVRSALMSAEQNAGETEGIKYDSSEYWRTAHDSVSQTSEFNEDKKIMQWFEAHGYRW